MNHLIGDEIGVVHLGSSVLALVFGTVALFKRKGTDLHKKAGYLYFFTMAIVLSSAFLIYRLTGRFGFFHITAILSTITLFAGILPMWFKSRIKDRLFFHSIFMYWSVLGLYMALAAEILTRIPGSNFSLMVFVSMSLIMLLGFYNFKRFQNR